MKKPTVVLLLLLITILTSCTSKVEPDLVPVDDPINDMPVPLAPKAVPILVDEYTGDPSQWQTYTFTIEDHSVTFKLPDGVNINPNIGECAIETTKDNAPPGFLMNSVYDVIKVGRIYFPTNFVKIDDDTYQASMFTGVYGTEEEIVTYTYSEELVDDVFFRYEKYIVFLSDGRGLFDAIEYYDEDSGVMISFWRPQNEEVFKKQSEPMFEDIVSTVEVSTVEAE